MILPRVPRHVRRPERAVAGGAHSRRRLTPAVLPDPSHRNVGGQSVADLGRCFRRQCRCAISLLVSPADADNTLRARSASFGGVECARTSARNVCSSKADSSIASALGPGMAGSPQNASLVPASFDSRSARPAAARFAQGIANRTHPTRAESPLSTGRTSAFSVAAWRPHWSAAWSSGGALRQ